MNKEIEVLNQKGNVREIKVQIIEMMDDGDHTTDYERHLQLLNGDKVIVDCNRNVYGNWQTMGVTEEELNGKFGDAIRKFFKENKVVNLANNELNLTLNSHDLAINSNYNGANYDWNEQ